MEKDKSRGLKHIKDKKKYKGNSTKNPKYIIPKSKENLDSNWHRYVEVDDEYIPKITSSTDFSILANNPISHGSYFHFKSDYASVEECELPQNDLFHTDINLLEASVHVVPFYKRIDMDEKYFSKNDIHKMEQTAMDNKIKFSMLIEKLKNMSTLETANDPGLKTVESTVSSKDDIDTLIEQSLLISDKENLEQKQLQTHSTELEEWLDEVLDD